MGSAYDYDTYDYAYGPPASRDKRRKQRYNAYVEDAQLLRVELLYDAEILARRNVERWKRLSKDDKVRLEKAEGKMDNFIHARSKNAPARQEPKYPDPPMPEELPPSPKGPKPITAPYSGINANFRKQVLKGQKPEPKNPRIKGLPAKWFQPVKEESDDETSQVAANKESDEVAANNTVGVG